MLEDVRRYLATVDWKLCEEYGNGATWLELYISLDQLGFNRAHTKQGRERELKDKLRLGMKQPKDGSSNIE